MFLQVTWVEHVEADSRGVHSLYQPYVSCGMGFGAKRWLCTLQRQCERIASVLANNIPSPRDMSGRVIHCGRSVHYREDSSSLNVLGLSFSNSCGTEW